MYDITEEGSLIVTGLKTTSCADYNCTVDNGVGSGDSQAITICGECKLQDSHYLSLFHVLYAAFNCVITGVSDCSVTCGKGHDVVCDMLQHLIIVNRRCN